MPLRKQIHNYEERQVRPKEKKLPALNAGKQC